jgi:hypothetical protein
MKKRKVIDKEIYIEELKIIELESDKWKQ